MKIKALATLLSASAIAALASGASAATLTGVGTYTGNAGIGTANGDVIAAPVGNGSFVYVTTTGGVSGAAGYSLGGERTGTELTTFNFMANAGDTLEYYFNYITSDGAGYSDYAYVGLNNLDNSTTTNLFNARTAATGNTVPGTGLPGIDPSVTLDPTSTAIQGSNPNWSALGSDSGSCYSTGCGYTGWVKSTYAITAAGNYSFTFGVTNWTDSDYQSGLAIAGLKVGSDVIIGDDPNPVPLPAAGWMLIAGLGGLAAMRRKQG